MYPERARAAHVAGSVKIWFTLDAKGVVTQAGVISGSALLSEAALSTVKSWTFEPGALLPNIRINTEFVYGLNIQAKGGLFTADDQVVVAIADRHINALLIAVAQFYAYRGVSSGIRKSRLHHHGALDRFNCDLYWTDFCADWVDQSSFHHEH
jgi:TonB family protein